MTDLIDTTEMYLRTIFELEEEGIVPLRARIAERLGHSGPTVSQTVARMERDGLLHVSGDRHLELTDDGRRKATRVMRKHRLAERLLMDVIGLEWELVHDEACRWEHVMSDQVERKLLALLTDPRESPYGNPIPGLDEIGGSLSADFRQGVVTLVDAVDGVNRVHGGRVDGYDSDGGHDGHDGPDGGHGAGPASGAGSGPGEFVVRRLGEPLQTDTAVMSELARTALRPGRRVVARRTGDTIRVEGDGGVVDLPSSVAQHVFVEAPIVAAGHF